MMILKGSGMISNICLATPGISKMDEFPGGSKTGQCFFFFRDSSIFERPDVPYFKLYWLLSAKARNDDIGGERNNIKSLNGFSRHDSAPNFKKNQIEHLLLPSSISSPMEC